ncbi:MAG: hypothetical protein ABJQ23_09080 [Shimia thalassica]|uniref:O-antigen ligase family protein n=1 Tax=Shimia thalassica TaxID=1715693 RepID=UPI00329A592E
MAKKKKTWFGVKIPIALFFIGILMPPEMSLTVGGLRFSGYRVVLIILFLPSLYTLLVGKHAKFGVFDGLVLGHSLWATLALIKWGGLAQGIESGGIYVIEFAGAYLLGRLYIRSYEDFAAFARAYVGVVLGMLIFTIPESLTEIHILRDSFSAVLGGPGAPYIDKRMGIERAFGPFDHPILYGVFSASAFSMAYYVVAGRDFKNKRGMVKTIGVMVATFLSGSGGPYVVLAAQIFVAAWERILKGVTGRWRMLFGLFGLTYFWIDLMSNRTPFHVFVTYLTFSPQSAYNRINIWNYGTAEVARHPIFGIGLGDWVRPVWMSDSMDNFWLLIAVRYGLPAWFMLVALLLGLMIVIGMKKKLPQEWINARHAWAFTLFGISVAACTVHLWNSLFVLFMFLIGSGVWMADTKPGKAKKTGDDLTPTAKQKKPRHTLF